MTVLRAAIPFLIVSLSACGSSDPAVPAGPPTEGGLPSDSALSTRDSAAGSSQMSLPPNFGALPPPASPHLVAYLDGLDALMAGRWSDAVTSFTETLNTAGDDPTFVLARGVAATLAGQFTPALGDLARARALGLRGREAELWTYAAEAMSGQVTPEHAGPRGPRSLGGGTRPLVSIPGHIVQGRDDYTSAYGTVIAYELGMAFQEWRLPPDLGGQGKPDALNGPEAHAAKLKAGQWFAAKAMRRADLAPAHLARAKALYATQRYEAALTAITYARSAYPDNVDLAYIAANSWLALGRPVTARREYTIALTGRTDFAAGYLGRAAAAARVGDTRRVDADLATAARLDRGLVSRARAGIDAEAASQRVDVAPDRLLAELDAAAARNASHSDLLAIATRVQKARTERGLRYDEVYQDTLRAGEDAIRGDARNPDRYAALARYIITEADNRGDAVEPRRERVTYRFQLSRERELNRAIQIADLGIAIDPRHAGALIQKATALAALTRYDQADPLADQALATAGNNAEALRLYARFRAMRANQMSAEAASLRAERCSSGTSDRDMGSYIERTTTTTCYQPSQADLSRAAQLEALAAQLRQRARSAMEKAAAVSKGTVAGFIIEADLHVWDGNPSAARGSLQAAVTLDPQSLEAQDALVDFYTRTGQRDAAEDQLAVARALVQTTAAPMLRQAWRSAARTAWQGASGYLSRARQLDPGDARVPAYLAMSLEGQGRTADAIAAYRVAAALDEAAVRLDESAQPSVDAATREPLDFGVAMRARMRVAALLERSNQPGAVDLYLANAAIKPRISRADYARRMFTAMLPDDQPVGGAAVPAPVSIATLLSQSSLAAARALRAAGRNQEADQQLLLAASYSPPPGTLVPRIGNASGDTNFADQATSGSGEAMFELAKQFLQAGDTANAMKYLRGATDAGIPDRLRSEVNQMNMALARMVQSQRAPDAQQQRDDERARAAGQMLAARARVSPELVGTWTLVPENQFLPVHQTLTIDANANYTQTFQRSGRSIRGKVSLQGGGTLTLIPDAGPMGTMYFEFTGPSQMAVQDLDGTKFTATRR